MSALFNFQSFLAVLVLAICTATHLRPMVPSYIDPKGDGFVGVFGRFAVVGERLSVYVAASCVLMAVLMLFYR